MLAGFRRFRGCLFPVGRREVEINSTERLCLLRLAENDRDLIIQSDAVPQVGASTRVGFDGFFHQSLEGVLTIFRRLVETDDEFLEVL